MGEKNNDQSIMDKSMRSVFVGNIPYEATEEKLKEIFSEVGPVISLKLVFDRESGKPKGYGFCEYKDQETALSAMRNLNGYEIGGRTLRVDNACTEKSRMEMQQLLQGPQVENPYGEHCDPEQSPEIITKTVASLPPEQMYELMKQMKACIQNNPAEARQMLLLNPQLAYALLQSMVVMRIVDPQTAVTMLFKANQMPPILGNSTAMMGPSIPQTTSAAINPMTGMPNHFPSINQDVDLRSVVDPRLNRSMDLDMRSMPGNAVPAHGMLNHMNHLNHPDTTRQSVSQPRPIGVAPPFPTDPRQRSDPRVKSQQTAQQAQASIAASQQSSSSLSGLSGLSGLGGLVKKTDASNDEKTQLIMQVLQLSDEQIAMLPPEQRNSIIVLKEQIAKSTHR